MSRTILTPSGVSTITLPNDVPIGASILIEANANPVVIRDQDGDIVGKAAENGVMRLRLHPAPWWRFWDRRPNWWQS